jgi:hypothetical protein
MNSYPVTSVRVGLNEIAPKLWNATSPTDLVVSGVNVGYNLGWQVYGSGTDNVAMYATRDGVPAVAFSGHEKARAGWDKPVPKHSTVYAELAHKLVETLVQGGKPFLPPRVWLNVNFPNAKGKCTSADEFKFVLTKIDFSVQLETGLELSSPDVEVCGNKGRLPLEDWTVKQHEEECVVGVSVGKAGGAGANAGKEEQRFVAQKLNSILTCLKK